MAGDIHILPAGPWIVDGVADIVCGARDVAGLGIVLLQLIDLFPGRRAVRPLEDHLAICCADVFFVVPQERCRGGA